MARPFSDGGKVIKFIPPPPDPNRPALGGPAAQPPIGRPDYHGDSDIDKSQPNTDV